MRVGKLIVTAGVLLALFALFALTVGFHRSFGPFYYSSDPICARVIDESTAQPVEGAVVVAVWMLDSPWYADRPLHASEVLTDANGEFVIPAMRKRRPWLMVFDFRNPEIHIYKPGFGVARWTIHDIRSRISVPAVDHVGTTTLPDGRVVAGPVIYSNTSKRTCLIKRVNIPLQQHSSNDPEAAVRSYDYLSSYAVHWLSPDRFPQVWHALVVGYESLPGDSRRHSHPNDYIAHLKESER